MHQAASSSSRWYDGRGNEEQASLRDRANLALGFASLQQQGSDERRRSLSRVRLDGPFTNKALLALGWAEANANRPRARARAVARTARPQDSRCVRWQEVAHSRAVRVRRARVQRAGAQQYRAAVDAYGARSRRIDESIAAIRQGGFLDSILEAVPNERRRAGSGSSRRCRTRRIPAICTTCWPRTSSRKA